MKMPGVLKDKRVQIGVAAAAFLGLIVLLRKGGGASAITGSGDSGTTPQSVSPAVMDSSGTDVYNAISSLGQGWENDLREYTSGLASLTTQVRNNTLATGAVNRSVVGLIAKTKPPSSTVQPPSKYKYVPIAQSGAAWNHTLSGIAKHYGTSSAALKRINTKVNFSHLTPGTRIRVK